MSHHLISAYLQTSSHVSKEGRRYVRSTRNFRIFSHLLCSLDKLYYFPSILRRIRVQPKAFQFYTAISNSTFAMPSILDIKGGVTFFNAVSLGALVRATITFSPTTVGSKIQKFWLKQATLIPNNYGQTTVPLNSPS